MHTVRDRNGRTLILILLGLLGFVALVLLVCIFWLHWQRFLPETPTEPPTTAPPVEPETVIATATISSQGDLLMHKPVFDTGRQSDGSYNFGSIFKYSKDLIASFDYAVANLETTFGGDNYIYQGNPAFNCPDALAANAAEVGHDMFLTSNNHSGDTTGEGVIRTLEVSREAGLATLGSQMPGEKRYSIVEINGIKVGMIAYTFSDITEDRNRPAINGLPTDNAASGLITAIIAGVIITTNYLAISCHIHNIAQISQRDCISHV